MNQGRNCPTARGGKRYSENYFMTFYEPNLHSNGSWHGELTHSKRDGNRIDVASDFRGKRDADWTKIEFRIIRKLLANVACSEVARCFALQPILTFKSGVNFSDTQHRTFANC